MARNAKRNTSRACSPARFNGYSDPVGSVLDGAAAQAHARHRVTRQRTRHGSEHTLPNTVLKPEMDRPNSALRDPATPATLATLAEQLRSGPLLQLQELQAQIAELTERVAENPTSRVEDLEALVRLSVSAMEHFNAFTREFAAVLRELTDADRHSH